MKLSELLPSELTFLEKKVKGEINHIRGELVSRIVFINERGSNDSESYFEIRKKAMAEIEEEHKEELSILDEYLERINKAFMSFE